MCHFLFIFSLLPYFILIFTYLICQTPLFYDIMALILPIFTHDTIGGLYFYLNFTYDSCYSPIFAYESKKLCRKWLPIGPLSLFIVEISCIFLNFMISCPCLLLNLFDFSFCRVLLLMFLLFLLAISLLFLCWLFVIRSYLCLLFFIFLLFVIAHVSFLIISGHINISSHDYVVFW